MASIQMINLPGDLNSDSKLKPKMAHNHVRMNSANFSDATPSSSLESTDLNWGQYAPGSIQTPKLHPQEFQQDSYTLYQPQPETEDSYGYQVSTVQKTQGQEMDFRRNPEFRRQNSFPNRENPFQNQENNYRNQENPFQNQENPFQNQGNNFQNQGNNFQNRENYFQNKENSYLNQENGYQNQENGYQNHENGYRNQVNNFQNQAIGFQKHEKVFQYQENPLPNHENRLQNHENQFQGQKNWLPSNIQNGSFDIDLESNNNAQRNQNYTETVNTQFPMDTIPTYADKGGYAGENSIHQAQLLVLASKLDSSLGCSGKHGFNKGCPDSQQYPDGEHVKCQYEPIIEKVYELPSFSLKHIGTFEESVKHWQNINRGLKLRNV